MVELPRKKRKLEQSLLEDFSKGPTETQAGRDKSSDENTDLHITDLDDDSTATFGVESTFPCSCSTSSNLGIYWASIKPEGTEAESPFASLVSNVIQNQLVNTRYSAIKEGFGVKAWVANGCGGIKLIAERQRLVDTRYLAIKEDFGVRTWVFNGYGDIKIVAERAHRKLCLKEALQKHDLMLRSDSRLCSSYIERNEGELEDVVRAMVEMVEMKWFFKHTAYADLRWFKDYDYDYDCDYDSEYECNYGYNYNNGRSRRSPRVNRALKELAIEAWAKTFLERHRDMLTALDDFATHLPELERPPASLHEVIMKALRRAAD
ncbi:hypothetical protein HDU85_000665 [Gaertneriomyces sp. JEL0708]|nr:hypothetical protein HDU85_000665 [Gaertneriomyces sp. JEL0708]